MESIFYTLQDHMTFTKGTIYVLMVLILACFVAYWTFLSGREEEDAETSTHHHEG